MMLKMLMIIALMISMVSSADNHVNPNTTPQTEELRLTNSNAISSLTPQSVVLIGNDKCKYYGSTKVANTRVIHINKKNCFSSDGEYSQTINKRAWMIEFRTPGDGYPLIPAGNIWMFDR